MRTFDRPYHAVREHREEIVLVGWQVCRLYALRRKELGEVAQPCTLTDEFVAEMKISFYWLDLSGIIVQALTLGLSGHSHEQICRCTNACNTEWWKVGRKSLRWSESSETQPDSLKPFGISYDKITKHDETQQLGPDDDCDPQPHAENLPNAFHPRDGFSLHFFRHFPQIWTLVLNNCTTRWF